MIGGSIAALLALLWAAGLQGELLVAIGLAGLTGTALWYRLRAARRSRRMAAALRTAVEREVTGENRLKIAR